MLSRTTVRLCSLIPLESENLTAKDDKSPNDDDIARRWVISSLPLRLKRSAKTEDRHCGRRGGRNARPPSIFTTAAKLTRADAPKNAGRKMRAGKSYQSPNRHPSFSCQPFVYRIESGVAHLVISEVAQPLPPSWWRSPRAATVRHQDSKQRNVVTEVEFPSS